MKRVLFAGLSALMIGQAAEARDLRAAPATPPSSAVISAMYNKLAEYLPEESDGALNLQILGMEIVDYKSVLSALQSGLADVANVLPAFFSSDVPNTAMTVQLALMNPDPFVMSSALTEYAVTCEECQAEFKRAGMVYTGSASTDPVILLTRKPINSIEDVKGLRLRVPAGSYGRWLKELGGIPVDMTPPDQFEAMSQGVIDGTVVSPIEITTYNLSEVAKFLIELPVGLYFTTATAAISTRTWGSLSMDERAAYMRATTRSLGDLNAAWGYDMPAGAREKAVSNGVQLMQPPAALVEKTDDFRKREFDMMAETVTSTYGITDAEAKLKRFGELVEKWTEIGKDTDRTAEAMAARVTAEVWDKVDLATYGQ
ncbi:C4-dicarboxylate TRAP transporter substrate-binding protein [Pseudooceanicola pacificus]|nr:C4-dicarboxylate TRAP transporter substrate-binding protein [Pseudooceanicola pacificus]